VNRIKSSIAEPPVWRSMLFVPASNDIFINKAHTRGADAIIIDLEDSIGVESKVLARQSVRSSMKTVSQSGCDVMVRINQPLRMAVRDLEAAVFDNLRSVVIPKANTAGEIEALSQVIDELETERALPRGQVSIIVQIETCEAMKALDNISAASRVVGISLGSEDFSADVGMEPSPESLLAPNQSVIFAARRNGIIPYGFIDSIADYGDELKFTKTIQRARKFGFQGALCIHPRQVAIMNQWYMPTEAEIEYARQVVEGHETSEAQGKAVFSLNNKMIDKPVVDRANRILRQAQQLTKRN
jgi:citrate lyase subunit beta / citryl-CoA lyase